MRYEPPRLAAGIGFCAALLFPVGSRAQSPDPAPTTPGANGGDGAQAFSERRRQPPEPMAWVHLQGPAGLRLEQDLDSLHHKDWNGLCEAPCDTAVPTALDFRVSGGGLFASKDFSLTPDDRGHATVRVSGGSIPLFIGGLVVLVGGGGTAFTGVVFEGLAILPDLMGSFDSPATQQQKQDALTGLILIGIGAPILIVGTLVMLNNRRPVVSGDIAPSLFPEPFVQTRRQSSLWEQPSLGPGVDARDVAKAPGLTGLASVLSVPLIEGSF
jgi:hypothetical protein